MKMVLPNRYTTIYFQYGLIAGIISLVKQINN
jgi:hypothetical protein